MELMDILIPTAKGFWAMWKRFSEAYKIESGCNLNFVKSAFKSLVQYWTNLYGVLFLDELLLKHQQPGGPTEQCEIFNF